MAQSDVVELIAVTYGEMDANGIRPRVETRRQVFAQARSAYASEFFGGGRNGLNPALVFEVFDGDYRGESILEYHGDRLAVYRTYQVPGTHRLELQTERKGGTNGTQNAR